MGREIEEKIEIEELNSLVCLLFSAGIEDNNSILAGL